MSYGKNKAKAIKDSVELNRIQDYLRQHNYKAYILFQIGLVTGYRGSDLIKLTVRDVKDAIAKGEFTIVEQKIKSMKTTIAAKKQQKKTRIETFERTASTNVELEIILSDYIKDMEDSEYLYSSQKGEGQGKHKKHIRRDSLGKIYKEAAVACGIANISVGTHTPRKTFGYIQYIENDNDINLVQELFGHATTRATKAYIGIDEDVKKKAANVMSKYMRC